MIRYLCKRLLAIIPVGLGVTFIIFSLLYLTPGDPARLAVAGDSAGADTQRRRVCPCATVPPRAGARDSDRARAPRLSR